MEEILASINRIISEDNGAVSAPAEPGGVLDLTEAINEDGSVRHLPVAASPAGPAAAAAPKATDKPESRASGREPPRTAGGSGERSPDTQSSERNPVNAAEKASSSIVSSAAAGATAAAFAELASRARERRRENEVPLGAVERTLEEIVREMLRPMLQAWLDQNLPALVERLVREEIARVVRDAGLR